MPRVAGGKNKTRRTKLDAPKRKPRKRIDFLRLLDSYTSFGDGDSDEEVKYVDVGKLKKRRCKSAKKPVNCCRTARRKPAFAKSLNCIKAEKGAKSLNWIKVEKGVRKKAKSLNCIKVEKGGRKRVKSLNCIKVKKPARSLNCIKVEKGARKPNCVKAEKGAGKRARSLNRIKVEKGAKKPAKTSNCIKLEKGVDCCEKRRGLSTSESRFRDYLRALDRPKLPRGISETDVEDSLDIQRRTQRDSSLARRASGSSLAEKTDFDVSSGVFDAAQRLSAGSSEVGNSLSSAEDSFELRRRKKAHSPRVKLKRLEALSAKGSSAGKRACSSSESDDLKSNVSFIDETRQQKRARIARNYIEHLDRSCRSNTSEVSACFRIDKIAEPFTIDEGKSSPLRLAIDSNGSFVYSCGNKGALVKWSVEKREKIAGLPFVKRNKINNVAISYNDKFIAISDSCGKIQIWTADVLKRKRVLPGHKVSVTCLKFHKKEMILYSAGYDKAVNIWCVKRMVLLQSLKAHTGPVVCLDLYNQELLVTGGCDSKVILWQIPECKHTVFKDHTGAVLAAKFLKPDYFISGDVHGQLIVWSATCGKNLCSLPAAHGCDKTTNKPHPIYSIAYAKLSELLITGSNSDFLVLFKFSLAERRIACVHKVRIAGYVNDLVLSACESCLVAAVGRESVYGDAMGCSNGNAKNCIFVVPIKMFE